MAAITAQIVKELREKTGCGMMDCKKALAATDGDMEKAIEFLREKGLATAAKKAGRIASEGLVTVSICDECKAGVVLEVNAETDFVAKNEEFRNFVQAVATVILKKNPADVEALLALEMEAGKTVDAALKEKIATIGENMNIRRFVRYEGNLIGYVHGEGRIGVMVKFNVGNEAVCANEEFVAYAKNVAMQIAAINPAFLKREEVPAETVEKEKEILMAQAINEGKPAAIAEKMVAGRIQKYYKENCLVEQEYVKNPDQTVKAYTEEVAKSLDTTIEIACFARLERGEGLEKKEENFADEVANMMK